MDAIQVPGGALRIKSGSRKNEAAQVINNTATKQTAARLSSAVASPEEALELLRGEPDYETLASVLRFLYADHGAPDNIRHPTPLSAQLVQVLVTDTLPNYWPVLREGDEAEKTKKRKANGSQHQQQPFSDLARLLACLRSVTGLSALAVRLRALLADAKAATGGARPPKIDASHEAAQQPEDPWWQLGVLVDVLSELLTGDAAVAQAWHASSTQADGDTRRRPLAQEFANLLGGGRLLSLASEAEALRRERAFDGKTAPLTWLADGRAYSRWLAEGIIRWGLDDATTGAASATENFKLRAELLGKALRLGYPDIVIATLVDKLLLKTKRDTDGVFPSLLHQLAAHEQKKILSGVLRYESVTHLSSASFADATTVDQDTVAAVAGLIQKTVLGNHLLQDHLVSWLLTTVDTGFGSGGVGIRRAAMAVVAAEAPQSMIEILEKSMADFGDQLFINHAPILQQEAKAQVLLLSAGYAYRTSPRVLTSILRSRAYLSAVSNRLGASQTRARILGMVVGEALSSLVDDSTKKLDFHMEEMDTADAKWYKDLVHVADTVGSTDLLRSPEKDQPVQGPAQATRRAGDKRSQAAKETAPTGPSRAPNMPRATGFVIEEVDDSDEDKEHDEDEDDDLVPYAKPDSDAEDSDDEEPTDRRDRPKAPVYIRDLIAYFRDTESYDKQRLALTTAPILIRRKANYGTEVQQHAQELASVLVGFQDSFEMEDYYPLRLQGMVALVVAQPRLVAAWLSAAFFNGDYSLAQRASILTALGVGARELAGLETSEYAAAAAFPSKQLPERVERLYVSPNDGTGKSASLTSPASELKALPRGAVDSIADAMTARFLGPIAAKAADEATGPDVLKLASFKSKQAKTSVAGKKPTAAVKVANTSAPVIATAFFFPLVARFQLALQAASASSARMRGVLFDPSLLSLYLKTVAVLLHAAGPSALSLPDMTAELWRLLLAGSVQAHCVGDLRVTHAVLFALMALLDVNENRARDLCRDLPREVVQTRDWVLQVLNTTSGGGSGDRSSGGRSEESELQMLAAGIYIRLTEGMESYKNLLLGEMIP